MTESTKRFKQRDREVDDLDVPQEPSTGHGRHPEGRVCCEHADWTVPQTGDHARRLSEAGQFLAAHCSRHWLISIVVKTLSALVRRLGHTGVSVHSSAQKRLTILSGYRIFFGHGLSFSNQCLPFQLIVEH